MWKEEYQGAHKINEFWQAISKWKITCEIIKGRGGVSYLLFQFDTIQLSKDRLLTFEKDIMIVELQVDNDMAIVMAS